MIRLVLTILLVAFALLALGALYVWASIRYWLWNRQRDREIANDLDISGDWVELTPHPPLKATRHVHQLTVLVDGYHRNPDDHPFQLHLPDGTTANLEVVIVDEGGESFRLRPTVCASSGVGYKRPHAPRPRRPGGISYTKVRMRSDKPFRASKVIWVDMNLK
jgi:hypothetical protein